MSKNQKTGFVLSGGGGRGSYEVGVLKYLEEMKIKPDMIAGTSVGAINAAAIAAGFTLDELEKFWLMIRQKNVFRYSIWKTFKGFFSKGFTPFLDTSPLRKFLNNELNIQAVKKSNIELAVPAVNITSGEMEVFTNKDITVDHIMASAAIPMAFPHITINQNKHYWDGGLGMNTPISPLIDADVTEIYVILLAPRGGDNYPLPHNRKEAFQRVLDMALMGSFETVFNSLDPKKITKGHYQIKNSKGTERNLYIIQPRKSLGVYSFLNFSHEQAVAFIKQGYEDAKFFLNANK